MGYLYVQQSNLKSKYHDTDHFLLLFLHNKPFMSFGVLIGLDIYDCIHVYILALNWHLTSSTAIYLPCYGGDEEKLVIQSFKIYPSWYRIIVQVQEQSPRPKTPSLSPASILKREGPPSPPPSRFQPLKTPRIRKGPRLAPAVPQSGSL